MSWLLNHRIPTLITLLLTMGLFGFTSVSADDPASAVEKGAVEWNSDLAEAKKLSAKTGRPIFFLFQEIPG